MVRRHRHREKRFRRDKLVSETEFLTGERRTKDDLPRHLEIIDPKKRKVKSESEPAVNSLTKKVLGHGKRPKWMDCQEEKVDEDGEKTENSS